VRRLIAEGGGREEIEAELKKPENGFVSLRENAMRLVREGITTTSELLRVISEDD
jgi:type IV pilus assembly protein PilB